VNATGVTGGLTLDEAGLIALVTPGTASKAAGSADGSVDLGFSAASTVFDYLAAGEKVTLTYTLRIGDGDGGFDWQTFVVVVTGTNDAPVISVNEGDSDEFSSSPNLATAAILSMNMDEGDPNYTPGETGIVVFNVSFDGGTTFEEILIEFEMGPSHVESVDNLIAAINAGDPRLQAENADLPYEFTLTALPDGSFAPIVASAEFTNTHTTESSEVGVEVVEAGTDGSGLAAAGTLTVRDVDVSDVVGATVVEVDVVGDTEIPTEDLLAMMSVDIDPVIVSGGTAGTISWEFDSGEEIFEFLAPGESLVLTYTIRATDTQGAFTEHQVTITIDNGDSVDGDLEAFASFDLLAFNGDTVEDDAESELFVLDDLSIHDVIADYQAGDVIDLTRLGFELATGELSQGTAEQFVRYDSSDGGLYVDVDGLGGPAEFVFAAQVLTAPQSILVRLTDGNTVVDAEFA
jgi:VCBS repeat-containing protein